MSREAKESLNNLSVRGDASMNSARGTQSVSKSVRGDASMNSAQGTQSVSNHEQIPSHNQNITVVALRYLRANGILLRFPKLKVVLSAMLLALSAVYGVSYAEQATPAIDHEYVVKTGDSLSKLSHEVLDGNIAWSKIAKYNKLPNAHLLHPGETLHFQFGWMKNYPTEAHIETLAGDVKLNGIPAKVGDAVSDHAVLETASGGSARMRLPDGSTLNVLEKSNIEAQEISKKEQGGFFRTIFKLVSGRIDAIKNKFPAERSPLQIQGMHGTIGVRGTHFRMAQDGNITLAEIEHGEVGFEAGKRTVALSGGQGSVADGVKAPEVIPLLGAPVLMNLPERFEKILVRVDIEPMQGAQAFRGEVANEEEFANIIAQDTSEGTQLRIPNLQDGTYWLKVRAIDERGLQGLESLTQFVLKAHPIAPMQMGPNNNGKVRGVAPQFTWTEVDEAQRYRFRLARDAGFKDVVLTQEDMTATSFTPEKILPVGEYFWRVASVRGVADQGPWGDVRTLRVLPPSAPPPAPAFTKGRMAVNWEAEPGQTFEYQVASSKDFALLKINLSLAEPKIDIKMPPPGKYFVRMRAIDADGYIGPWTPTQSFTAPGYEVNGCGNCQWGTQ